MTFADRRGAGRYLADLLDHLRDADPVVLGLPGGGVPVALEVARHLGAPLDVIVVRKLGAPFQPELAMGALGEDGVRVVNREVVRMAAISDEQISEVERVERAALDQRVHRLRRHHPRIPVAGRTALIVDDGIATGSTARAACAVARAHGAGRVVLAVPVAPPSAVDALRSAADEVIAASRPEEFVAVGEWYDQFAHVTDDEVIALLDEAATLTGGDPAGDDPPGRDARAGASARGAVDPGPDGRVDREVRVTAGPVLLDGHLVLPADPRGLVIFAHGSGSSRHSPRNAYVAGTLNDAGLGTVLFDLLTADEERDRGNVFDIGLLARRLEDTVEWVRGQPAARDLPIGLFGASTGAAAALYTAARLGTDIGAVVSRGGRPDLAGARLGQVRAPTLLIVGGRDELVLDLNRAAQAQLRCPSHLAVVPGATHLFEEPGTLRAAAELARGWFLDHLAARSRAGR